MGTGQGGEGWADLVRGGLGVDGVGSKYACHVFDREVVLKLKSRWSVQTRVCGPSWTWEQSTSSAYLRRKRT